MGLLFLVGILFLMGVLFLEGCIIPGRVCYSWWGVLLESAGNDKKICISRPKTREDPLLPRPLGPHQVDRKLDFLVSM